MRLFSSLRLVVAPPACKPGQDTPAIFSVRVLTTGSGSAAAFGSAFARGHGSRLFSLKLPFTHSPAVSFLTSPGFGSFHAACRAVVVFPVWILILSRLSASFFWLTALFLRNRQSHPSVLIHSSNLAPFGDCDSSRLETILDYLIRLEAASNRFSPPGSSFRIWRCANTARGTGEYCLAGACALGF